MRTDGRNAHLLFILTFCIMRTHDDDDDDEEEEEGRGRGRGRGQQ
jgi:hypothetical protein